jgi:hypothetical protein
MGVMHEIADHEPRDAVERERDEDFSRAFPDDHPVRLGGRG